MKQGRAEIDLSWRGVIAQVSSPVWPMGRVCVVLAQNIMHISKGLD